ncbi:cation-translocating P-type ATPase [Desulfocurvibacter africanus]|nr:HAD-IC family P-type ATPase [Desulfocurvibacter africanus]
MEQNITGIAWHTLSADEALKRLESSPQGLTPDEAARRFERFGPNDLGEEEGLDRLKLLLDQVKSPLIYILLAAAGVTAVLDHVKDALVILAVIIVNTALGYWQELRAEKSIRALRGMVKARAWVLRDGKEKETESAALVPGDIVLLASGDRVPADLRLLSAKELKIEEAALTGESVPADKTVAALDAIDLPAGDRANLAFMSTVVVAGRGRGVVTATGRATLVGQIAEDVRTVSLVKTPLQDKFERFAKRLGLAVLGLSLLVFAMGLLGLAPGVTGMDLFMTAVAMAVAIIPEGLPVVVTITMAIGVSRMAKRNAVIRKLHAVETLGSTTVICTDKTGTLTRNEMTVRALYSMGRYFDASGSGYELHGSITDRQSGEPIPVPSGSDLEMALRIGLLCAESNIEWVDGVASIKGDPTEAALIVAAMKANIDPERERALWPTRAVIPFESHRGFMATLHERNGHYYVFLKGGPEKLLDICALQRSQVECGHEEVLAAAEELAREGLRVLSLGWKELPHGMSFEELTEELTHGVTFAGLAAIIDPPRKEAAEAVASCAKAGIRTAMITGDHVVTARAIAAQIGIGGQEPKTLTGREIEVLDDAQLQERVADVSVFARVSPRHKLRIAQALMASGEVVAMTGDGVNDAPALKAAHIGVSMGRTGTEVAKEAADMVLADDNFASIFHAVEEGRIVFENIRKVTLYLLAGGAGILLAILSTLLLGFPLPLNPTQIIWLNFVTGALQDVALAFEEGEPGILDQPPRNPKAGILSGTLLRRILLIGAIEALGVLYVFNTAMAAGRSLQEARTLALTTLVCCEIFQVFNCRSLRRSVFRMNHLHNPLLFAAIGLAVLAQLTVLYVPQLEWLVRTVPLSGFDLLLCLAVASSVLVISEMDKLAMRRFGRQPSRMS